MYTVTVYQSSWEIKNKESGLVVLEGAVPYEMSNNLDQFFRKSITCKTDQEVLDLYENMVRKWQDE